MTKNVAKSKKAPILASYDDHVDYCDNLYKDYWKEVAEQREYDFWEEVARYDFWEEVVRQLIVECYGTTYSNKNTSTKIMEITIYDKHWHGNMPAVEVLGVTKEFHEFISSIICSNRTKDPWYIRKNELKVNPFFQGGYVYNEGDKWIFIEFWTKEVSNVKQFFGEVLKAWYEHTSFTPFNLTYK
ncbi:MAG: hypothetical protein M0P43_10725 [Arcobacteraceae bacterium]|nr:hypothetical protein [Arcobacteraceae bacterium]